jgi:hypothetical protein
MLRKVITAIAPCLVILLVPAAAEATSTLALPDKGKLDRDGRAHLTVRYSCPPTTSEEDSLLWLFSSQDDAAGDTAVTVTCDGKRHKYRASLNPNIGEPTYSPGTLFVEAFLGAGAESIHAYDSGDIPIR